MYKLKTGNFAVGTLIWLQRVAEHDSYRGLSQESFGMIKLSYHFYALSHQKANKHPSVYWFKQKSVYNSLKIALQNLWHNIFLLMT